MHLSSTYCIPAPVRVLGVLRRAAHPPSWASLSRGHVDKEQQCLLEETVASRPEGAGGWARWALSLRLWGRLGRGAASCPGPGRICFLSRRGNWGSGKSSEPWRCEGRHFLGGRDIAPVEGSRRRLSCQNVGSAGLFLVLSWGRY